MFDTEIEIYSVRLKILLSICLRLQSNKELDEVIKKNKLISEFKVCRWSSLKAFTRNLCQMIGSCWILNDKSFCC